MSDLSSSHLFITNLYPLLMNHFLVVCFSVCDLQMRQKEADHCNNNSVIIQRNNDATINNTKMTTTTNNTSSNKDSTSDQQTKQTTATLDSNATQQTNYDSKPDSFAMVSTGVY